MENKLKCRLMENVCLQKLMQQCYELKEKTKQNNKNKSIIQSQLKLLRNKYCAITFKYKQALTYCTESKQLTDTLITKYKAKRNESTLEIFYSFIPNSIHIKATKITMYCTKETTMKTLNSMIDKTKKQLLNRYNNQTDFINVDEIFSALNKIKLVCNASKNPIQKITIDL